MEEVIGKQRSVRCWYRESEVGSRPRCVQKSRMLPPARGEARSGGKLSVFPHLALVIFIKAERVRARAETMQVIHERCAALDVHKKTVVTTIMITQADGSVQEEVRTFLTMTADLLALDDWLRSHRVEVIAMESTGVFLASGV